MLLDEKFAQQVLRAQQAVFLAGAKVGQRGEIFSQCCAGTLQGRRAPGGAEQGIFAGLGPLGGGRHAAIGHPCFQHQPFVDMQVEGCAHGTDVVIQALGDFIGAKGMTCAGAWDDNFLDEFAFLACSHPVVDEIVLNRQGAAYFPFAQHQLCTESDQQRGRVANG